MPTSNYTEEQFILGLRNHDREVFSVLYDQYSGALYGVVHKILNNREWAEDIIQEAFLRIWEKSSTYDSSKGRLFTWMLNIARNAAIDALRSKQGKWASKIQSDADLVNMGQSVSTSIDGIDVPEIVSRLLPEQNVIIELMYFQGYSQDEVAKELGIPLGTVKTRARAGLMRMREIYNTKKA
ncbi:MAG: sigma-70 family RNA polymerase sigma factor [Flavobacteriales bacterium]|nr:sigma-70 family RNA polymerase sigma factor [Flavobacteriales bacterium]